jgi:hypothetical protein
MFLCGFFEMCGANSLENGKSLGISAVLGGAISACGGWPELRPPSSVRDAQRWAQFEQR